MAYLINKSEGDIYLNTVSTSCLELERSRHRDWTGFLPKVVETKMVAVDPEQLLIPFIYHFLTLYCCLLQRRRYWSFPFQTQRPSRRQRPKDPHGTSRIPWGIQIFKYILLMDKGGSWCIQISLFWCILAKRGGEKMPSNNLFWNQLPQWNF